MWSNWKINDKKNFQIITTNEKLHLQEQIIKNDFRKQIDIKAKAIRADISA